MYVNVNQDHLAWANCLFNKCEFVAWAGIVIENHVARENAIAVWQNQDLWL